MNMNWFWTFLYYVLTLLVRCNSQDDFGEVGDICKNSHLPGVCRLVQNCPIAREQLKRKHNHNLTRCGFQNLDEIVCCPMNKTMVYNPDNSEPATFGSDENDSSYVNRFPQSKRKCEEACDQVKVVYTPGIATFLIINGTDAEEGEFPHMAALGYNSDEGISWECGGSIISDLFVLTAAHCLVRRQPVIVRMGVTLLNDTGSLDSKIDKHIFHDGYDTETKHNDIGLVKLSSKIRFTDRITAACLYSDDDDPLGLLVSGWGKTQAGNEDDRSNVLQKTKLVPYPLTQCNSTYLSRSYQSKSIVGSQICAYKNGTDSCTGDSGGPLQIRGDSGKYYIVGIVSYGAGCATKTPSVYTRVSSYLDWIEKNVWPSNKLN